MPRNSLIVTLWILPKGSTHGKGLYAGLSNHSLANFTIIPKTEFRIGSPITAFTPYTPESVSPRQKKRQMLDQVVLRKSSAPLPLLLDAVKEPQDVPTWSPGCRFSRRERVPLGFRRPITPGWTRFEQLNRLLTQMRTPVNKTRKPTQ